MNRDEILRMAEELVNSIEEFAEKIAAAEREECARLCDEVDRRWINQAEKCAERIRARGEK